MSKNRIYNLTVEENIAPCVEPIIADGRILVTPPLNGDFWVLRVKVSPTQAIIVFPKFGTFGCGFAVEKNDWNVNLPIACPEEEIWQHIKKNKGNAREEICRQALHLIREHSRKLKLFTRELEERNA